MSNKDVRNPNLSNATTVGKKVKSNGKTSLSDLGIIRCHAVLHLKLLSHTMLLSKNLKIWEYLGINLQSGRK